jgi:hypothetical protein
MAAAVLLAAVVRKVVRKVHCNTEPASLDQHQSFLVLVLIRDKIRQVV